MKTLVAIISAHSRPEYQAAARSTWLPTVPVDKVDTRFFLGRGATREPLIDEVFLDCADDYLSLPEKCQGVFRWARDNGYEHVMKQDDDVILKASEWVRSGFEGFDFTGNTIPGSSDEGVSIPYGFCYVLSKKSMEAVIEAPLPRDGNDEAWVAKTLYKKGTVLHVDPRYFLHMGRREDTARGPQHRPLRNFNRPFEREPIAGTFAWCIYLNWYGLHLTPTEDVLKEYKKVWERVCLS